MNTAISTEREGREYRDERIPEILNDLGEQGWELTGRQRMPAWMDSPSSKGSRFALTFPLWSQVKNIAAQTTGRAQLR